MDRSAIFDHAVRHQLGAAGQHGFALIDPPDRALADGEITCSGEGLCASMRAGRQKLL